MPTNDPEIDIINARKLRELREKAAAMEKAKANSQQSRPKSSREIVSAYLYDRANEVLDLAYGQYPVQTEAILTRIARLILSGEITSRISGGELLMLFRSIGLNIRVNTTIKVEDDGKLISLSEKLKQQKNE
ncbi:MAG: double-stranded DNA-binding protein [Thermoproteota archaeon]|nr:double-stranded DNA-binding protein [Thermoproteota archaeon]MDQ3882767.1 double-stranded DNA-binding protein [Thermoproteota archaeon]